MDTTTGTTCSGNNGYGNFWAAHYHWDRLGKQRETMGNNEITFGLDITSVILKDEGKNPITLRLFGEKQDVIVLKENKLDVVALKDNKNEIS